MAKENFTYVDSYRDAIKLSGDRVWEEIIGTLNGEDLYYTYYDSPVEAYDREFAPLEDGTIGDFLQRRRSEKGQVYALDQMGTLDFATAAKVDGQMAITLVDFRSEEQRQEDEVKNRVVVTGSTISGRVRSLAQQFIKEHDTSAFPGFDLITRRPLMGYRGVVDILTPPKHKFEAVRALIQRDVSLLSNGGMAREQLPFHDDYSCWADELMDIPGLDVRWGLYESPKFHDRHVLQIVKKTNNKIILPPITNVGRLRKPVGHVRADGTVYYT